MTASPEIQKTFLHNPSTQWHSTPEKKGVRNFVHASTQTPPLRALLDSEDVHGNTHSSAGDVHGNVHSSAHKAQALVIEDIGEASQELVRHGYECQRITHNELMSLVGEEYTGRLLRGEYALLWISTPADWYIRTPNKRSNPHWQNTELDPEIY